MLKFQKLIGQCLGIMLLMLIAKSSWALSCYQGTTYGGNRTQVESITQPVYVANGITAAGTTLWRSQTYTTTFTCFDTDRNPQGENAYLYWDPQKTLSTIHNSIKLGITVNSVDYNLVNGSRLSLGQQQSQQQHILRHCITAV